MVVLTLPPAPKGMRISGDLAKIGNAVSFFDASAYKHYVFEEIVMRWVLPGSLRSSLPRQIRYFFGN